MTMRVLSLFSVLFLFSFSAQADFPIMQGPTSADATQIVVVLPREMKVRYQLVKDDVVIEPEDVREFTRIDSTYKTEQALFEGLQPRVEYKLRVVGANGKVLDERILTTLDILKRDFRMAVVSCSADRFKKVGKLMWQALSDERPDIAIMSGDSVYAGLVVPRPPSFVWKRHVQTRHNLPIFRAKRLIPMVVTWDDHDIGGDNINREYKHLPEAKEIFDAFYPRYELKGAYEAGPGVSSLYSIFGVQFVVFDGRSFRAPTKGGKYYVWGKDQFDWFKSEIAKDPSPVFLVNGTQFFAPHGESILIEDKATLNEVVQMGRARQSPFVFLSGDVHFSEVMKLPESLMGYPSVEITSSAIHSYAFPFRTLPKNKLRVVGTREFNFVIVDVEASRNALNLKAKSVTAGGRVIFSHEATVKKP